MFSRAACVFFVSVLLGCWVGVAARAEADVTVFFAAPPPPAAPVAEVVDPSELAEVGRSSETAVLLEPSAHEAVRPLEEEAPSSAPPSEPVAASHRPTPLLTEAPPAPAPAPAPAMDAPLRIIRVGDGSREEATLPLLDDAGRPDAASLRELSLLARPRDRERPSEEDVRAHEDDLSWVATDLRRLHPGLLLRLAELRARFPDRAIEIISGFRPDARETSRHRIGSALDLRVVGVSVAELDAFLSTLRETGVGLYPTSAFVHMDVRPSSAHWVDLSGPGEPARPISESRVSESRVSESRSSETARSAPTPALDPLDAASIAGEITGTLAAFDLTW